LIQSYYSWATPEQLKQQGSKRYGLERTNYYQPNAWLTLDLDLALSHAEYDEGGDVPGSVGRVLAAGIRVGHKQGPFASLRVRHFGDVPLIEDRQRQGRDHHARQPENRRKLPSLGRGSGRAESAGFRRQGHCLLL
jgi:hypothetical protein